MVNFNNDILHIIANKVLKEAGVGIQRFFLTATLKEKYNINNINHIKYYIVMKFKGKIENENEVNNEKKLKYYIILSILT